MTIAISVIIPVYNSAETLLIFHERLSKVLSGLDCKYEIIFVDDASADDSWLVLRQLCLSDPNIIAIRLKQNSGQGASVLTGMSHAQGSRIVTLDDDLEQHPEDLPRLLASMDTSRKNSLVIAAGPKHHHSLRRRLASVTANALCNIFLKKRLPLYITTFCALDRTIAEAILGDRYHRGPFVALLITYSDNLTIIDVPHRASILGGSRYSFGKLLTLFFHRFALASRRRVIGAIIAGIALLMARHEVASLVGISNDESHIGLGIGIIGALIAVIGLALYLASVKAKRAICGREAAPVLVATKIRDGVELDVEHGR